MTHGIAGAGRHELRYCEPKGNLRGGPAGSPVANDLQLLIYVSGFWRVAAYHIRRRRQGASGTNSR